jgi:hypothetical protein
MGSKVLASQGLPSRFLAANEFSYSAPPEPAHPDFTGEFSPRTTDNWQLITDNFPYGPDFSPR